MSALATLGILTNQIPVSLAVMHVFHRTRLDRWLRHMSITPVLAAASLAIFLALVGGGDLSLLSGFDSPIVSAFPYLVVCTGLFGVALGYYLRTNKPHLSEGFGSLIKSV
jgi:hypothetical protein